MKILEVFKKFFGMGTVKVSFQLEHDFVDLEARLLVGAVVVTGKSDQQIKSIELSFDEDFSTRAEVQKTSAKINWGKLMLSGFPIKKDEVKTIPFELPFSYEKSKNEAMASQGGFVGGLGKVGTFLDGEKQKYELSASVHIQGVAISPMCFKELKKSKSK